MRKIVVAPTFASAHFLKCWIPNILEVLKPDYIFLVEGLMPFGPENKGNVDTKDFLSKWTLPDSELGFDFNDTLDLTRKYRNSLEICPNIVVLEANYRKNNVNNANQCFLHAISRPNNYPCVDYKFQVGDIIFPMEPDAFLLESDREIVEYLIRELKPGQGISCKWVDFLETQYYTENINLYNPKYRRFAYCFDNLENYLSAMSGFMSQSYPMLKKTDEFFIRHYCWFQPEPYKQLRYDLIYRSDPQYWKHFDRGLQDIRLNSEKYATGSNYEFIPENKILIRPSRQDEARWAQLILEVEHPEAIKNHPNFIK